MAWRSAGSLLTRDSPAVQRAAPSASRPASVIRMRRTSIMRLPARTLLGAWRTALAPPCVPAPQYRISAYSQVQR
jgi:hypothetical protein